MRKIIFNQKLIKYILCVLSLIIIIFNIHITYAISTNEYFNKFNQIYTYDDIPTLKIEAFFDDKLELSEMIKSEYEFLMKPIPDYLKLKLKENNIEVYIVKSSAYYYSKRTDKAPNGFFNSSNNQIFISLSYDEEYDTYEFAAYRVGYCLYHEIGHALDHIYGNQSNSKEFKEAFDEENKNNYQSFGHNSSEIFADIFQCYIFDFADISKMYNSYNKNFNTNIFPKCYIYTINILSLENIYDKQFIISKIKDLIKNIFTF